MTPLLLASVLGAPRTDDNAAYNVNLATDGSQPESYYGAWPGHTYYPSPSDWREMPIYQLITDRFADGDPSNGRHWPHFLADHDPRDMTYRHGGDFRGLEAKLDYIQGLGCRAVWISPIFQNGFNHYHQYGQRDFTLLDKRFGTLAELRSLVEAAHARGIYVLVDIVVNHMANDLTFVNNTQGAPFTAHAGIPRVDSYDRTSVFVSDADPMVNGTGETGTVRMALVAARRIWPHTGSSGRVGRLEAARLTRQEGAPAASRSPPRGRAPWRQAPHQSHRSSGRA